LTIVHSVPQARHQSAFLPKPHTLSQYCELHSQRDTIYVRPLWHSEWLTQSTQTTNTFDSDMLLTESSPLKF